MTTIYIVARVQRLIGPVVGCLTPALPKKRLLDFCTALLFSAALGGGLLASHDAAAAPASKLTQKVDAEALKEAAELTKAARRHRTRLVLLGTAGGPTWYGEHSPHGISSAVVVDGHAYIVDLGSGAYRQIRAAGIKPGAERAVFFTHLHTDHVIDTANLLMYDPSARKRAKASLQIFGPGRRGELPPLTKGIVGNPVIHPENPSAGTRDFVESLMAGFSADQNIRVRHEGVPDVRDFFQAHDIQIPESVVVDPNVDAAPPMQPFLVWEDERVRVSATLVPHGLVFPNFAYRFDTADGSVVFSGDTAVSENLIRLAKGADILVHELIDPTWVDEIVGPKPWDARQTALNRQLLDTHTTPEQVGSVAERAGVRTLVLSHLVPGNTPRHRWLKAQENFSGRLIVGQDLIQIGVGQPKP